MNGIKQEGEMTVVLMGLSILVGTGCALLGWCMLLSGAHAAGAIMFFIVGAIIVNVIIDIRANLRSGSTRKQE